MLILCLRFDGSSYLIVFLSNPSESSSYIKNLTCDTVCTTLVRLRGSTTDLEITSDIIFDFCSLGLQTVYTVIVMLEDVMFIRMQVHLTKQRGREKCVATPYLINSFETSFYLRVITYELQAQALFSEALAPRQAFVQDTSPRLGISLPVCQCVHLHSCL